MIRKGDVVAVVNMAGEYVGKFNDESPTKLTLDDPRMIVNAPEGLGFAHGICVTGVANARSAEFYTAGIVFVTAVNPEIEKAYIEATTGIII